MLFKAESSSSNVTSKFETHELERQDVDYTDGSKRFCEVSRDFSKQYAYIYSARLKTFRNILAPVIRKKWSDRYKVLKLCELREKGTKCVIVGTLFKFQELKPSILKELSDQLEIIPQAPRTHFVHESDSLVLEDELQRIKLVGDCIDVHQVVTGVVCALLGSEDEDGEFTVEDVCWAGCSIQKPLPKLSADRYIVLMSGLNASNTADHLFSMHLFLEWLTGLSGTSEYQAEVSKIVRVIVAGGVFANHSTDSGINESQFIESVELIDTYAAAVGSVAPLDLMPSSKDPTGIMLPQKPFHYCLFPKAIAYKSFNRVSNPYECDIGALPYEVLRFKVIINNKETTSERMRGHDFQGFTCLGTSGEPIKDIMRYSKIDNSLEAMKKTLQWRHVAPTCPDTIPCTPCIDTDPFIIYNCPAIYFNGNSAEFATDMYQGEGGQHTRLVCVPNFSDTKTIALVNLANLECYSMKFS